MRPNSECDATLLTDRITRGRVVIKRDDAESEAIVERASRLYLDRCHLHLVNSRTFHLDDSSGVAIDQFKPDLLVVLDIVALDLEVGPSPSSPHGQSTSFQFLSQ